MHSSSNNDTPMSHEIIAAKAHEFWQKAGSPDGRDLEFWLAAEHEVRRERDDVEATRQGDDQSPPRSTPNGDEPAGRRPSRAGQAAKRVRR